MKRRILLGLTVLLVIAFTVPVFAAPWGGHHPGMGRGYGQWAYAEPTAEQKAEIDKMNKQLFEERKQMIENRVQWGYLSRGEADSLIAYMQERMKNNPGVPLYGPGNGRGGNGGGGGRGGRGGCGGGGCGGGGGGGGWCW